MGSLYLYRPGDRFSPAELTAARIDGDLTEIGEAFMPTDAVETADLRGRSLRGVVPSQLAATRATAAWVHGALADLPVRLTLQRASDTRVHRIVDARIDYSDQRLPLAHMCEVGGMLVSTPERTLADLVRDRCAGMSDAEATIAAMIAWRPGLVDRTARWLAAAPPVHHKRAALAHLRRRAQEVAALTRS
ncbi:hypothetical protein [Microbacterium sp. No. 7]|uniref:hypothetical protein n=1 Tax=Microbacterium sp. No. 7 TaxID=1714373 RepID=UPI0006D1143C|nr:hypothetical protein [Microbacterium sp. No. 7]ALJ20154.1 SAM-dependent methyltransferase [Microbacterium sp. No. 7]